jgi:MFS transporter, DHA1 family, multidrug resistance protein
MVAIAVATAIAMMGQGVVAPILPLFAGEMDASTTAIGMVVGAFGISRLFLNIPAGLFGERFGRTALMSSGLAVTAAGMAMTGASSTIGTMIAWRIVAGAGSAMFMTGAQAYVADISTPENRGRLMSVQQGALLFGVDVGPVMGGIVGDLAGLRWPFFIAGALSAGAAVWTAFRLPNRPAQRAGSGAARAQGKSGATTRPTLGGSVTSLLKDPTFLLVGMFTLVIFFTRTGSRQTLIPLLGTNEFGMSATHLGVLFAMITTINFFLVGPSGWMSDRFGRKPVMAPGLLLGGVALVMFAYSPSIVMIFVAGVALGIGQGIAGPSPAAYIADLAPAGKTSAAMGLYRTFGDVGFVIGPPLLGLIADNFSLTAGLNANAVLIAVVAFALILFARETAGRRARDRGSG